LTGVAGVRSFIIALLRNAKTKDADPLIFSGVVKLRGHQFRDL